MLTLTYSHYEIMGSALKKKKEKSSGQRECKKVKICSQEEDL